MIRLLKENEDTAWLEIAEEVEELFGSMVNSKEFQNGIKECIKNNNAYCISNEEGDIAGIIALDRKNNEITWLAVRKKYRGCNIGEKLVNKAIQELESNGNIYVQTFAPGIKSGMAARYLYEKNGFVDYKIAGKNPAGIETIIMVKKSTHS